MSSGQGPVTSDLGAPTSPVCPSPDICRDVSLTRIQAAWSDGETSRCRRQAGDGGGLRAQAPWHCHGVWGAQGKDISSETLLRSPQGRQFPAPCPYTHTSSSSARLGAGLPKHHSTKGHPCPAALAPCSCTCPAGGVHSAAQKEKQEKNDPSVSDWKGFDLILKIQT